MMSLSLILQNISQKSMEKPEIIGLGAIGRRVAEIARAFGAKVIYYSASGAPAQEGYEQVDFETLLTQSGYYFRPRSTQRTYRRTDQQQGV